MKCRSAGAMRDTAGHSAQGHAGRERRLGLLGGESRRRAMAKSTRRCDPMLGARRRLQRHILPGRPQPR